mgnify:CR=1 FL=1
MIIWGWGKQTRKKIGNFAHRACSYCNTASIWQLCLVRTWFTLFFIPIIPYAKSYQISCPNCKSYIAISKEDFMKLKEEIQSGKREAEIIEAMKYEGKTETQINYLKAMEPQNAQNSEVADS